MTPAQAALYERFKNEVERLDDVALLDRWIAFDGSPESTEPDLGLVKSMALEGLLHKTFGVMEWRGKVDERRKAVEALAAELADKKEMLGGLDAGKITLPPEQVAAFRKRVAELEMHLRQLRAPRS